MRAQQMLLSAMAAVLSVAATVAGTYVGARSARYGGGYGDGNSSGSGSGSGGSGSGSGTSTTTPTTEPLAQKMESELSSLILAGAWIPFCVVTGVALVVSFLYVKFYQHKRERECGSTTVAVLALTAALTTLALVPVDIFLVSQQKLHSDGSYEFSPDQVSSVKDLTTYAYYAMYALLLLFAFLLLPLAYFFFEEKDEEAGTSCGSRLVSAFKYTLGFLVFMAIMLLIGAFAVAKRSPCDWALNSTKSDAECGGRFAEESITQDSGANAVSFTIGLLAVIGFMYFAMYTATGMVTMPIKMIRERGRASKSERAEATEEIAMASDQRTLLLNKYGGKKKKMSSRDRNRLLKVQDRERTIQRAVRRVDDDEARMCGKLGLLCSPFAFIFGLIFFLLSVFLMVSLMMTLADKLLDIESKNLGWEHGYSASSNKAFYPVDRALTLAIDIFPVDYVLVTLIVYYFFAATMSGVKSLGVRFCHLQMFKIRPRRTPPQGILFMAFILMFTMISLNVVLLALAPQYVTFGNQVYVDPSTCAGPRDGDMNFFRVGDCSTTQCIGAAPPQSVLHYYNTTSGGSEALLVFGGHNGTDHLPKWHNPGTEACSDAVLDELGAALNASGYDSDAVDWSKPVRCATNPTPCLQTRVAALLHSFFYNFWFLGAIYYWAEWLGCLVFFIALVYYTCKRRKSIIQSMINEVQSDFDDSDDDMTPFKPSWT